MRFTSIGVCHLSYLDSGRVVQDRPEDAVKDVVDEGRGGGAHGGRVVIRPLLLSSFHHHFPSLAESDASQIYQGYDAWSA